MIADPFFLQHIVAANAEIATAIENLDSDDPNYDEKRTGLVVAANHIESMIVREVSR